MELISHHQLEEFGKVKRTHHVSIHFPESLSLASILAERCVPAKKDSELEWLAKDNPETNPITIKPKSHVAEQCSWVPSPSCSPPRRPFSIKSLALSAHVSPWTIQFWVLDKSPVSGPGSGPPSCNKWQLWWGLFFTETDILTTRGTQGPACLPMDQTQWPHLGPFCPWSSPDADNWPECPDRVRNKSLYWSLSPSLSLSSP